MKKSLVKIIVIAICLLVNISCDRITKKIAKEEIKGKPPVSLLKNTFVLTYAENDGAFLSFLSGVNKPIRNIFLIFLPVLFCLGGLIYLFMTEKFTRLEVILLSCVFGGGISNLFDRILYGRVTDFMNFGIGSVRTGIVNAADLSITFGIILFMIFYTLRTRKEKNMTTPTPI